MLFKHPPFKIENNRCFYEPRALWSVGRVGTTVQPATIDHPAGYLALPKEHFRNVSRYPIRITHAIVSPVGYLFRSITADTADAFDSCMAGIGRMKMAIAFPRRTWLENVNTDVFSFGNVATGEPSFDDDPVASAASGLFGVSRWTFDPSYIVPRTYTVDFQLSTIQAYDGVTSNAFSTVAFHERGGRMLGHARVRPPAAIATCPEIDPTSMATWPASHTPCAPDYYGLKAGTPGNSTQAFPADSKFPSNEFNHQLASRGLPYTEVTGFAVALEQTAIDDSADITYGPSRVAPLSQRILTKARTVSAGTQESWWRDGAPLSLVTPTMNNAGFVHRFAEPFVLGPGEGAEVSLQAPPARTFDFEDVEITVDTPFNVGVSFCGYAVVEDNNVKVFR